MWMNTGNTTIIQVEQSSGNASIISPVDYDREYKDFYSVNVEVKDKGNPKLTSNAVVMLYLRDVDDNPPKFTSKVFTGTVAENSKVGTTVLTVSANDMDSPNSFNSLIVFETVSCQPDWLMVDRYKGDMIVKDNLDYESSKFIVCYVSAYSSNQTSFKDYATVNVTVTDVNDRVPTFDQVFYKGNATENSTNIGALVVRVNATDPDAGNDGKVLYSIDDPDGLFAINNSTGEVTVLKAPDYEVKTSHLVTVYAEDQGTTIKNKNSVFVQVTIDPVNEFPPTFNSTCLFSVPESKLPGDAVHRVTAIDLDAGMDGAFSFTLVDTNSLPYPFRIDSSTGDIRVSYPLDYETVQSYTFNVSVHDNSTTVQKTSMMTCSVTILNVNDSDVTCQHVPTKVLTSIAANTVVAQLICNDPDTNGIALVSYGLCVGNDDGSFQISNQGLVTLKSAPIKNQYQLTVCVYDSVNLTQVTFTVLTETTLTIQNLPAAISVVEGVSGLALIKVNACCAFPNVVYSILTGNEDGKVTIDSATGQIGLTVPYDREIRDRYVYVVQAKADSGQTVTQNLTVNVEDNNDNPPVFDSNVYEFKIVENYAGTVITTIKATDKDAGLNSTLSYSITIYNNTVFSIDSTGTLKVGPLDYETQRYYSFEIIAADGGVPSLSGSATVHISILNVDEFDPVVALVPSVSTLNVSEDTALGTPVFRVQGSDNDTGTTFVYSIVSGNTNNDFVIDPVSGNVTTWRFLDRETTASYALVVRALNQGGKSATATLSVVVNDVNDCNPIFTPSVYVFYVPHNWNSNQVVGSLSVSDADTGINAQTTLALTGTNFNDFSLNGLDLKTNVVMNYLSVNYYKLTVVATDGGNPKRSSSAVIIVYVSPATDTPKFNATSYNVSIPENWLVGSTVFDFNATVLGARENGSLSYSIMSGNTGSDFLLRASSGQLIIQNSLDFERTESYTLVINANIVPTPATNQIASCTLTISIENLNDNSPIFKDATNTFEQETFSFTVDEGTALGSVVGTVLAEDKDKSPYGTVTHSLSNTTKFSIDAATGVMKVNGNLDYTEASYYYLVVMASDGVTAPRTAKASVVIRINDINDHSPVFITASSTSVLDSTPAGSEIFRFRATDKDTGDAGVVIYLDPNGQLAPTFELNATTGVLNTLTSLDALKTPAYTVTIQAKDQGIPVLSADQTFTINVISTVPNNNDPVFQPPYSASVQRQASVGTSVITVPATDADLGVSGQLVYTIASGNIDGYFIMGQSSGKITTAASVMSAADSYSLTVVATDLGNPPRSANTTVTITVTPQKTISAQPNYVFTVNESATGVVGRINVDKVRAPISYVIASKNVVSVFSIVKDPGTNEGVLSVSALDYETLPLYSMEVNVDTDIGVYTKIVEVRVLDENDNAPVFSATTITLTIPENLPVGHTVETISATDADVTSAYRSITLAISSPGKDYFSIDQSGHLMVKVIPDYETWTTDTIVISATDQLQTSSVTVTINLIDVTEQQDVSTSSLTNNALISLEVPYQATSGHLIHKLTAGDFGINVSSTANIEFVSYKSDVPFSIDSYSGQLTVTGSPALQNHAKYFMWVLCRTRDGSVTTSQISLIRVDTFDLYTQMAVIEFAEPYATVYAKRESFRVRAQMYFSSSSQRFGISNIIDNSGSSRRRLLATNTIAYTYVVSNTQTTNDMANVNQDKTFLTDSQILSVLQQSSDGTPVNGLSDPNFLEVTKVEPYQETQESSASEFVSSPGGIVMFCLLALLLLIALAVLIACLCYRKKKRDDRRKLLEEEKERTKKKERGSGFFFVRENSEAEFLTKKTEPPPPSIHSYKHKTPSVTRSQASVPDVVLLDVSESKPEADTSMEKPEDSTLNTDNKTAAQLDKELTPNDNNKNETSDAAGDPRNKQADDKKKVPIQKAETNNNVSIIKNSGKKFSGTSLADSSLPKKSKGRANAGRKTSPSRRTGNSRKPKEPASGEKNEPKQPEISDQQPSKESTENLADDKMEEVSPTENGDLPGDGGD
ncbi:hypothetical protein Btru_061348 [Bulinus truncatus]|nr:hypothetical protein Btru_061348 [Bulinus truncatus]